MVWTCGNFCLSACKKSTSCLTSFLRYRKNIAKTCCFGYFKHAWLWPLKTMVPASRKLWFLSSFKNYKFMSYLFLAKILQFCYFGYFKHAWQPIPKQQYVPERHFYVYWHFFLEILHFNKFSIWLAKSILTHNLRKRLL